MTTNPNSWVLTADDCRFLTTLGIAVENSLTPDIAEIPGLREQVFFDLKLKGFDH